jgi:hypothetical protein
MRRCQDRRERTTEPAPSHRRVPRDRSRTSSARDGHGRICRFSSLMSPWGGVTRGSAIFSPICPGALSHRSVTSLGLVSITAWSASEVSRGRVGADDLLGPERRPVLAASDVATAADVGGLRESCRRGRASSHRPRTCSARWLRSGRAGLAVDGPQLDGRPGADVVRMRIGTRPISD